MCNRNPIWWALVLAVPFAAGCESSADSGGDRGPSVQELTAQIEAKNKAATPAADPQESDTAMAANDASTQNVTGGPAIAQKAGDPPPVRTQGGYFGAISGANRNIRLMVNDLPWKESVKLFEAEHGHKPRDTKEFMERIRREGTPLPDVAEGTTYLYVPEEGQFGELYQVPIDSPAAKAAAEGGK
jgi:hypothetical protein